MPRKRKSFIQKYYRFNDNKNEKMNLTRISMPFTIRCTFCAAFTFKGSKQNALKKFIKKDHNADIFLFFIRCRQCNNEMSIQTNPVQCDYLSYAGCKKYEVNNNCKNNEKIGKKIKTLKEVENEILDSLKKNDLNHI